MHVAVHGRSGYTIEIVQTAQGYRWTVRRIKHQVATGDSARLSLAQVQAENAIAEELEALRGR